MFPVTRAVPVRSKHYWFGKELVTSKTDDCRRFFCCPALNLVFFVFLNNVGKKVKYKVLYYAAVFLFWLRPVLLQAAPRSIQAFVLHCKSV